MVGWGKLIYLAKNRDKKQTIVKLVMKLWDTVGLSMMNKPSQAKPSQAKPSQAKPSQAKPSQAKPSQ
jgi:hypothetical protein